MLDLMELARELGFDQYAPITIDMVATDKVLADSCTPQSCQKYASCWTCPPGAGSFEELQEHFATKSAGILVQTVRDNIDYYEDWDLLDETRALHHERLDKLANAMRAELPGVLEFSTGGCDLCKPCSYPDAPCLKPDEQRLSLSAHGVAVSETSRRAGMEYAFENGRVRFVGMILYEA